MKFLIYKKPCSCKNKTIRQKHEWPPCSTSVISSHHLRDPSFLIDSFGNPLTLQVSSVGTRNS